MLDAPDGNMVQEKKKVAANIAMAFMQHQQLTQQLAQQMVEMMQELKQQNQMIIQLLTTPKRSTVIRHPQTGDIMGSEQVPIMPQDN